MSNPDYLPIRTPTPGTSPPRLVWPDQLVASICKNPTDAWYTEHTPPKEKEPWGSASQATLPQTTCPTANQAPCASYESPRVVLIDDARARYKSKNRVAAAKCRAKKKTLVDKLEGEHGVKKSVNTLLRHTQLDLRDELSFWRMQAVQHSCCGCQAIQNYNLCRGYEMAVGEEQQPPRPKTRPRSKQRR
ncbi:hypothetical protein ANO11243_018270 [Dothideomycetidae sp. 11243]|nr:hypothetical protein ANO11243_018270 [fungal sp. No.11243]